MERFKDFFSFRWIIFLYPEIEKPCVTKHWKWVRAIKICSYVLVKP